MTNGSDYKRDMVDWVRAIGAILGSFGIVTAATLYVSGLGDRAFGNLNDPRFPWNHDKQLIEKRIADNEKDLEVLLQSSRAQRDSIHDLKVSTENLVRVQHDLSASLSRIEKGGHE